MALEELECDRKQGWVEGEVQEARLCLCWDSSSCSIPQGLGTEMCLNPRDMIHF